MAGPCGAARVASRADAVNQSGLSPDPHPVAPSVSRPHPPETGAFRISGFGTRLALWLGQTSRALVGQEDTAMTEDLLLTAGVLIASAICGWYVVHAISGVVLSIPVDDTCTMAAQCLALAGG
jgi:hypothetical protein